MNALKNAVLHLLNHQMQHNDPSLVRLAQRHHEAVSSEPVPQNLSEIILTADNLDPEALAQNIEAMKRSLPLLKINRENQWPFSDDLPNALAELPAETGREAFDASPSGVDAAEQNWGKPIAEVPFTDGQAMIAPPIQTESN